MRVLGPLEHLGPDPPQYIWVSSIISLVLLAIGICANLYGLRVMLHRELHAYSCTVFLGALALCDTFILVLDALDDIAVHLPTKTGYDLLYGDNQWACRFGVFFYETARLVSCWLVVSLAAELCLVGLYPKSTPLVYSRKRAMYVSLAVGLIAVAGCFPFLVISTVPEQGRCGSTYQVFFEVYIMFVLRVVSEGIVPFLMLAVCCSLGQIGLSRQEAPKVQPQARSLVLALSTAFFLTLCPATIVDMAYALQRYTSAIVLTNQAWNKAWYITHTISMINFSAKFIIAFSSWPACRAALGGTGLRLGLRNTLSGAYYSEVPPPTRPQLKQPRGRLSSDDYGGRRVSIAISDNKI